MNIGLVFGTDTGNTEEMGDRIAAVFAKQGFAMDMLNVTAASPEVIEAFDFIIMGIPTWDFGGVQEDWETFESELLATNLSGKVVALYGLGDQLGYGDYFVDAMGWLHDRVVKKGALVVGEWSTEGYDFEASLAVNKDKTFFCGLAIDDEQQFHLTDQRISGWVDLVVGELQQLDAA
jgi:flavodoxin I/flavodoxin II